MAAGEPDLDPVSWRHRLTALVVLAGSCVLFVVVDRSRTTTRWPGGLLTALPVLVALTVTVAAAHGTLTFRGNRLFHRILIAVSALLWVMAALVADATIGGLAWRERGVTVLCTVSRIQEEDGPAGYYSIVGYRCADDRHLALISNNRHKVGDEHLVQVDPAGVLKPRWPPASEGRLDQAIALALCGALLVSGLIGAVIPATARAGRGGPSAGPEPGTFGSTSREEGVEG